MVPAAFLTAREIFGDDLHATGIVCLIAATPQLMITAGHIGNDSMAIGLGAAVIFALFRWIGELRSVFWAAALGITLGLALLTKAYFLALAAPLLLTVFILLLKHRTYKQAAVILGCAAAIAGWWYAHNWIVTGTLSGEQIEVAAHAAGSNVFRAALQIDWLRAADTAFSTHI